MPYQSNKKVLIYSTKILNLCKSKIFLSHLYSALLIFFNTISIVTIHNFPQVAMITFHMFHNVCVCVCVYIYIIYIYINI